MGKTVQIAGRILLVSAVLIGSAIRIGVLCHEVELSGDARNRYHRIASNISLGHGFSRAEAEPFTADTSEQPLYPYFVAGIYLLSNSSPYAVIIVQLFSELAAIFLLWLIMLELGLSDRIRKTALSIALIFPLLPFFSGQLLTETLATFFLSLSVLFVVYGVRRGSIRYWIVSGLAGGAAVATRPDAVACVLLIFAVAAFLSVMRNVRSGLLVAARNLLFLLVSAGIVLAPWTYRNYVLLDSVRPLGSVLDQTDLGYVRWLNTWLDRPQLLDAYWWKILTDNSNRGFPEGKIPEAERVKAESLLVQMRSEASFAGNSSAGFSELALSARKDRSIDVFVAVPLRRVVMTTLSLPSYINAPMPVKTVIYLLWFFVLATAIVGIIFGRKTLGPGFAIMFVWVLGRAVLPLTSALAVEPRYLVEALPPVFVFSALGTGMILGWFFERIETIRAKHGLSDRS